MLQRLSRHRKIVLVVVIATAVFIAATALGIRRLRVNDNVTVEGVRRLVQRAGPAGPLVFILLCASTNVFSPLVITPFWIAGILVFKSPWSLIYIYAANLLGHSFNFLIAKRWGRKLVVKFTGKKGLEKIDEFTGVVGLKMIFLLRLLGGAATDYISYALGLTNLSFRAYFVITAAAFLPWMVLNFYLIEGALQGQMTVLVRNFSILALLGYVLTLALSILVYRAKKKSPPPKPLK